MTFSSVWQNPAALPDLIVPLDFVFLADPGSPHTARWVDGLVARGHRVTLVPDRGHLASRIASLSSWVRNRWRVRRLLTRRGAVLVVQYVPAGVRATVLLGIHPRIAVAWGSDIFMATPVTPRRAIAWVQQHLFLRGCDAVMAPSRALLSAAIASGAPTDRAVAVPFGVDLDRFAPGRPPDGLRTRFALDGRRVVLSNRTIAPLYHQQTVVEALRALPDDVVVLMTRHLARPAELLAVQQLASDSGLSDRVRIVDEVAESELPELYRLADVVVSLASSDGGPITLLEAMATGRPIVATDLPAVREWLLEIDPEALVPVGDALATARAIRRALDLSEEQRTEIARREREAVVARGDRESALSAMEALHRAVTSDLRRGTSILPADTDTTVG